MIAIITGDISNSRKVPTEQWLVPLKETLNKYGSAPKKWEIYRGDSFQLEVEADLAIEAVLHLKATLKQVAKVLDMRIAIGVGTKTYNANKITESNGSAFIRSGECFEKLKSNKIGIETESTNLNYTLQLLIDFASLIISGWTEFTAKTIKTALENPTLKQKQIGEILGKHQSMISRSFSSGGYDELQKLNKYFKLKIKEL